MNQFGILGIGAVAVDELIYVSRYPAADSKTKILRREKRCGGLTGAALLAAARLGCRCAYAGVVGTHELWQFALSEMSATNIDLSHASRDDQSQPGSSIIIVDSTSGTRTIFSDTRNCVSLSAHPLPPEMVQRAQVLLVDHVDAAGMIGPAQLARANSIPVVGDLESTRSECFADLFELIDHLIVSKHFASQLTCADDPSIAAKRLLTSARQVVVVTCGGGGCWYVDRSMKQPAHVPAVNVQAVNTTGCGDVFHGAYATGLVRQMSVIERVRFATAAAALHAAEKALQADECQALADSLART